MYFSKSVIMFLFGYVYVLTHAQSMEEKIDAYVQAVMECADIPGISLAVIQNGQDFIAKGYGTKEVDPDSERVTNETLFIVNSLTKAFMGVTAALVLRENPSSIDWTTPVRDILGDTFYLSDSHATQFVNLRDLLAHRVGLSQNNEFRWGNFSEDEAVERLRFLELSADFRDVYKYNNLMYGLAAYTLKAVDGRRWEDIVREELMDRLEMSQTTFIWDEERWPEIATPHAPYEDGRRAVSLRVTNAYYSGMFTASGGIASNAVDMSKWIKFQLSEGKAADGSDILTVGQFRTTHYATAARFINPDYSRPEDPVTYGIGQYALGWNEQVYREYLYSQHGGSLAGFNSLLTIMRSIQGGIFTSLNVDPDYGARDYLHMYIMDLLIGVEPWLNASTACDRVRTAKQAHRDLYHLKHDHPSAAEHENAKHRPEQSAGKLRNHEDKNSGNSINKQKHGKGGKTPAGTRNPQPRKIDNEYFVGVYGNYAYGNLSIYEEADAMWMEFGKEGFVWRLYDVPGEEETLSAVGVEPIWYDGRLLEFQFESPTTPATAVTVPFDSERPPVFERNLDWANPPPPPTICSNKSKA